MSHTILLQDWITIRGTNTSVVIIQPEHLWADLSGFQDVESITEFADISGSGGNPTVSLQSGPVREDVLFATMLSPTMSLGVQRNIVRWATASPPPAKWWRWIAGSAFDDWSITFRIILNANPGNR